MSSQSGSGWYAIKIAADDIPNVQQGRTVVPGLLTREGVERFKREYGEDSPVVRARVHAEFPAEAVDALVRVEWLDRAAELHRTGALEREAQRAHHILGVDPARLGPDRTAVCVRQGPVVRGFEGWTGADTMTSVDRIEGIARALLTRYDANDGGGAVEAVYVDEIGLGGGVLDRLRETLPRLTFATYDLGVVYPSIWTRSVAARPFNAGKAAGLPDRFRNQRAQGFWTLRKLLEDGRLALPDLPELREELLAIRVRFGSDGRTEIEAKDAIRDRLGRSPDYADSLVISLAPMLDAPARPRARVF